MTSTVPLTAQQTEQVLQQAQAAAHAIANSATTAVSSSQFVFFAAFDGTDNAYVPVNGDTQNTAIAQLYDQVFQNQTDGGSLHAQYYNGVGTPGTLTGSAWYPPSVTQQSITTAQQAYNDFAMSAFVWLQAHPGGSVTSMIAGFSRGCAAEAIFAQMLYANGLVYNGQVLIPPGTVGAVSAALAIDPVLTGESGNMDFPPGVQNLTVVRAENEYRSEFTAAQYGADNDAIVNAPGDHSDAGDAYDNGLGGIYLGAYTSFLKDAGLNILPVLPSRQYVSLSDTPIVIHSEVALLPPYEISFYNPTNNLSVLRETTSYGTPVAMIGNATVFTAYNGAIVVGGTGYTTSINSGLLVLLPNSSVILTSPSVFSGTIDGFVPGDTIDLAGIGTASGAVLGASNVLAVQEAGGGTLTLQLDPAQDFTGFTFAIAPDGGDGTDITITAPTPAPTPVATGFVGDVVTLSHYYPSVDQADLRNQGTATVSDSSVEFPDLSALPVINPNPPGIRTAERSYDFNDNKVTITYSESITSLPGSADVITTDPSDPAITGVTLDSSTTVPGFTPGSISFSAHEIALNYSNVSATTGEKIVLDATFVACYAAGTRILTGRGEVPVEQLTAGDQLVLFSGAVAPVKWIGSRQTDWRRHPDPHKVWPVRVAAGAFGGGVPRRDLWLSPDHAVYIAEVMIPIKHLINGASIAQEAVDDVTYYHVELPRHDVLLAEGLPAESYLDTGDRSNFEGAGDVLRLFPDFSTTGLNASAIWEAKGYAPLVVYGPQLEAARRWVNSQLGPIAHASAA